MSQNINNYQNQVFIQKIVNIINNNEKKLIIFKNNQEENNFKSIYDYFSQDEIYLIQRTIETETYQQNFSSKCNVASVILNRFNHQDFPNNITRIITMPNQFDYKRTKISEDTIYALEYVWQNGDTTNGALAFHSNKKSITFYGYKFLFRDDAGHCFYGKDGDTCDSSCEKFN